MRRLSLLVGLLLLSGCASLGGGDTVGRKYVVFFTKASPDLDPAARAVVAHAAGAWKRHPDRSLVVAGYAAAHGSLDADAALSAQRAHNVTASLQADGVPSEDVREVARQPSNEDPGVAARRVEIGFAAP